MGCGLASVPDLKKKKEKIEMTHMKSCVKMIP